MDRPSMHRETAVVQCPGAVMIPQKWEERPLLVVVAKEGHSPKPEVLSS